MIQANELRIGNWVKYQFHDRVKAGNIIIVAIKKDIK
tara:strand:- start:2686 stop:2796 length:111 start_codon:yes stop_codon:yes gene_type:complete